MSSSLKTTNLKIKSTFFHQLYTKFQAQAHTYLN